jgi:hypothetical protein
MGIAGGDAKTSAEWDCLKCHVGLNSFVFSLKSAYNIPPKTFALKPDLKQDAVFTWSNVWLSPV